MHAKCNYPVTLPDSFRLSAVASAGPGINLTGTMWTGSGAAYQRALQAPGAAGYALLFSDGAGAQLQQSVRPRLNVMRIR